MSTSNASKAVALKWGLKAISGLLIFRVATLILLWVDSLRVRLITSEWAIRYQYNNRWPTDILRVQVLTIRWRVWNFNEVNGNVTSDESGITSFSLRFDFNQHFMYLFIWIQCSAINVWLRGSSCYAWPRIMPAERCQSQLDVDVERPLLR